MGIQTKSIKNLLATSLSWSRDSDNSKNERWKKP